MIMPLRLGHISTIKEVNLSIWVMWSVEFFSIFLIPIHHVPLQICCRGLVTKYSAMRSASNFAICFPLTIIHSLLHSFMALCWNLLPSGTVWIKTWQGFETHTKMQHIGMATNLLNHQHTCKWFCARHDCLLLGINQYAAFVYFFVMYFYWESNYEDIHLNSNWFESIWWENMVCNRFEAKMIKMRSVELPSDICNAYCFNCYCYYCQL